jgi:hypothetical protein
LAHEAQQLVSCAGNSPTKSSLLAWHGRDGHRPR